MGAPGKPVFGLRVPGLVHHRDICGLEVGTGDGCACGEAAHWVSVVETET